MVELSASLLAVIVNLLLVKDLRDEATEASDCSELEDGSPEVSPASVMVRPVLRYQVTIHTVLSDGHG